jgi:hypothetical protein
MTQLSLATDLADRYRIERELAADRKSFYHAINDRQSDVG